MNDPRLDPLLKHPFIAILLAGGTGFPVAAAAKSGVGRDGEINFYRSGSTIVMQMYDAAGAGWRTTTLT